MSNKLDWATPAAALATAIAGTSGKLAATGNAIATRLDAAGTIYDTAYLASGAIDTAKGAWITEETARWTNADTVARHQLGMPSALTFSAYDMAPLAARVASAKASASSSTAAHMLGAALDDVDALWSPAALAVSGDPFLTWPNTEVPSVRRLEMQTYAIVVEANAYAVALA